MFMKRSVSEFNGAPPLNIRRIRPPKIVRTPPEHNDIRQRYQLPNCRGTKRRLNIAIKSTEFQELIRQKKQTKKKEVIEKENETKKLSKKDKKRLAKKTREKEKKTKKVDNKKKKNENEKRQKKTKAKK
uniref:Uncharacterized protein n=1 Tax=Romanomermis culicivorax TaxID=13658 RepID=A0A915I5D2_ROMCU